MATTTIKTNYIKAGDYTTYTTTELADCSFTYVTGDISSLYIKDSNEFKTITEYVPNKVYGFTFNNGQEIKTVCDEEDEFNLDFASILLLLRKIMVKCILLKV